MSDPGIQAQVDAVTGDLLPTLHELTGKHDFRLLAAVLLEEAASLLQAGISTGAIAPNLAVQYVIGVIPRVLQPREKKAVAIYSHEGTTGRKN